jgi:tetratricopeptide (TPR) repeat protein
VYNRVGAFYYRLGRYPQAVEMFRRVVDLVPDSVRGWNNLGAAYQQMDHFDEAMQAYAASARVQPNDGAYSNLGTLQFFLGRYADAAQSFEHAARLSPSKALYWANLGDAFRWAPGARGKSAAAYERAIALSRERLETDPKDADARITLGLALAKTGKPAQGMSEIQAALAIEPGNPDYFYDAAVVANLLGRSDDAIGWLRRAVDGGLGVRQIEREPEFQNLRGLDAYKKIFVAPKAASVGEGGRHGTSATTQRPPRQAAGQGRHG